MMSRMTKFLFKGILVGVVTTSLAMPNMAWGQPRDIYGKDSQVFRPETPGYRIKKDQEKAEELMKVPAPPSEEEKTKDKKPQDKEIGGNKATSTNP